MVSEGKLLVVETASVPHPALGERAREVAAALGLDVFDCCVLDESAIPPALAGRRERMQKLFTRLLSRSWHSLERRLEAMRADGLNAEGGVVQSGALKETVLDQVREQSASLVMMLRRPHTPLEQKMLSGDDFAVVRECPVPVWIVNPRKNGGDTIVGAVDRPHPDPERETLGDRILDEATALAKRLGKESHAVYAFGAAGAVSPPIEKPAADPQDDMGTSRTDRRVRRLYELASAHGIAAAHAHVYEGRLVRVLAEEAEYMNADVVVVGDRRDGRLKRILTGSTAEGAIEHVPADVLVVKPVK